jgi:[ribosomal protein S5]-alanine N-acetyltransferase
MTSSPPDLRTERLAVRMADGDDAPAIARYFASNREHLAASRPLMEEAFYTERFWRTQTVAHATEFREGRSVRLFVFPLDEPERVIGNVNFTQLFRHPLHACVLGYGLDAAFVGQGLMSEAVEAAVRYMFEVQRMHRINANYVPRNERSGRLLRRLGFAVEGYARDLLVLNGRWEDHILTSRINPDWSAP